MKQKIIDFPPTGLYPYPDPSSSHVMELALGRFEDAGWVNNDTLPKLVENIITSIKHEWRTDIPFGMYDNISHSIIGFCNFLYKTENIDKIKLKEGNYGPLDHKVLFARISFGPESKQKIWDKTTFDRLHISAYGKRIINPIDELYKNKNVLMEENIYLSLKWINDKFLDYTPTLLNPEQKISFEELRATYFLSKIIEEKLPIEFTKQFPHGNISKEVSKSYKETVSTSQDKERIKEMFCVWGTHGSYRFYHNTLPELGYEHVLGILSKHGNVKPEDFSRIKEMNHIEGAEYFMNKIIPAMKNFVDSKTV